MSNKSQQKGKTKGLGRGLGSLIGENTRVDVFSKEAEKKEAATTKAKIISRPGDVEISVKTPAPEEAKQALKTAVEARIPDKARIWNVDIANVYPNADQPRKVFTEEAIKELSASVKEKGILQPIVCRRQGENKFEIIAGERRWRAAQAAGLHEVPVIIKETTNQEALELALIENIQRQDLNPIEEAEAYDHLMREYNLTQQQLAERMGKERATVANLLRLNGLSKDVKSMVMARELSLGQAKVLLGINEDKLQRKAARKIIKNGLSVRQTEKLVQKLKGGGDLSEAIESKPESAGVAKKLIRGLEEDLQKTVGSKVSIDYNKGKGKISLSFYSDDELNTFVERLKKGWQK